MSTFRTIVLSCQTGYSKPPESQSEFFQAQLSELAKYIKAFRAMYSEPLLLDDSLRNGLDQFIQLIILGCETLIVVDEQEKVIGICIYNVLRRQRHCEIIGWVAPEYRAGLAKQRIVLRILQEEILPYAWNKLKCVKITSSTHCHNHAAIRFNKNFGLKKIGVARKDMLIQNQLFDAYMFECINPAFEIDSLERPASAPVLEPASRHVRV